MLLEKLARHIRERDGFDLVGAVDDEKILPALTALARARHCFARPFNQGASGRPRSSLTQENVSVLMSAQPEPTLYDAIALGAMGYWPSSSC
jgi:hypothetical protein